MADVATVHQLRPVRVLVAGNDPAFVARATEELLALGFAVISTTTAQQTAELAALHSVNVVLLDVSGGVAAAAATASVVDALPQRVHVLLAGKRSNGTRRLGYEVVRPDAPGEELAAAVHRAYRDGPHRRLRRAP
jgi:hypothetical protein